MSTPSTARARSRSIPPARVGVVEAQQGLQDAKTAGVATGRQPVRGIDLDGGRAQGVVLGQLHGDLRLGC